jgi:hypothetical protein
LGFGLINFCEFDMDRGMAELLKAVGFYLDVTGIAVAEAKAGAKGLIELVLGIEEMVLRRFLFVQVMMAAMDGAIGGDKQFGSAAEDFEFELLGAGVGVSVLAMERILMETEEWFGTEIDAFRLGTLLGGEDDILLIGVKDTPDTD